MIGLVEGLLSRQDPTQPHKLLTRLIVSLCVCFAFIVLYGFYGLAAAVIVYLIGIELLGMPINWMYYTFALGLLVGGWKSVRSIIDYWRNYGYANSDETG